MMAAGAPVVISAFKPIQAKAWAKHPDDWYVEPRDCTAGLVGAEAAIGKPIHGLCWDPACGQGNTIEPLIEAGLRVVGTDVRRRTQKDWFRGEHDFLVGLPPLRPDNIVMNPPSKREIATEAFIRRAVPIADRVYAFVNLRFLCGVDRAKGLYAELPPTKVYFITPRVSCPPGDFLEQGGKAEGGKADYVWLVWRKGDAPEPPGWIVRPGK